MIASEMHPATRSEVTPGGGDLQTSTGSKHIVPHGLANNSPQEPPGLG